MAKVPAGDDETFYALEADLDLLLRPSPLLGLPRRPSLDQVENALRGAASSNGTDPLARETRRRAIAAELQELGVKHPQRLVDAALDSGATFAFAPQEPAPALKAEQAGAAHEAGREALEHPRPLELLEESLREMGLPPHHRLLREGHG